MKLLIWFGCFFVFALVQVLIKSTGIILGGIPTALLAYLTFWTAKKLCDRLDSHRINKKSKEKELSAPVDTTMECPVEDHAPQLSQKQQYCKLCGGAIDNQRKKCTKCDKQYFRITKTGVIIGCMCILLLAMASVIIYQHIHYENNIAILNDRIAELEEKYDAKSSDVFEKLKEIVSLKRDIQSYEEKIDAFEVLIEFYDDNVVFVSNDGNKYHSLACEDCDWSCYWAYNIELAEEKGYSPCSKCRE